MGNDHVTKARRTWLENERTEEQAAIIEYAEWVTKREGLGWLGRLRLIATKLLNFANRRLGI